VLDGVYRRTDGEPVFVQADSPTDEDLQALLHKTIMRLMKLLTRRGVLVEEEEGGSSYLADVDADSDEARALRPLQAAACAYRIAFGPRAGQKVLTMRGAMARDAGRDQDLCADQQGSACMRRCAAMPTSASGWSSFAEPSPARHWPMNAYRSTPPGRWYSNSRPPGATAPRTS